MKKRIPVIHENLDDLKQMLHETRDAEKKLRLNMLVLFKSQQYKTRISVANHLGVHRNTIGKWLTRYEEDGIHALLEKQSPGCPKGQRTLPETYYKEST